MKLTQVLRCNTDLSEILRQELRNSVIPNVEKYWSGIILNGGPVPKEIQDDEAAMKEFPAKMEAFGRFVAEASADAFGSEKRPYQNHHTVHYIGVGSGYDLRPVTEVANGKRMSVKAYDTARAGVKVAKGIFREIERTSLANFPRRNAAFFGDIERICQRDIIKPTTARFLILVRVLETLNKPSEDPEKMVRTCRAIGEMLHYLKVIHIGASPECNEGVSFSNTEPESLSSITKPMGCGFDGSIATRPLGSGSFTLFSHTYSATLIEKAS